MGLKIMSEPKFLILKDKEDYVFYNSVRHFSCRLSLLDLSIFNLIYTVGDVEEILASISQKYHDYVKQVYAAVESSKALDLTQLFNENEYEYKEPPTYYLHLTYKCNLDCIYCYNKQVRSGYVEELSSQEWFGILDKILPFATRIILTGGEPFLSKSLKDIVLYIKNYNKDIYLEIISNCMVDYSVNNRFDEVFMNVSHVTFSCDNLSNENQPRKNFSPDVFKKNVGYIRRRYPNLPVTVSSVYTCENCKEVEHINNFCTQMSAEFKSVLIAPGSKDEAKLLPSIEEFRSSTLKTNQKLPRFRLHCGAAIGILSISPNGEVFPCQSLMLEEFRIGSLRTSEMCDIMKSSVFDVFRKKFCVDNYGTPHF